MMNFVFLTFSIDTERCRTYAVYFINSKLKNEKDSYFEMLLEIFNQFFRTEMLCIWAWWHTSVVLATWKSEAGGWQVPEQVKSCF